MPAPIFKELAEKGRIAGVDKMSALKSREWFREIARKVTSAEPDSVIEEAGPFERVKMISANSIGKMYFFMYNAKWKDKLPYWDRYPIIFPLEFYPDHKNGPAMLGINLHYLPPLLRAKLMNSLYNTINNDRYDKTTKLQISYSILAGAAKYNAFKPCVKKYLFSHVESPLISINPKYWDMALFLPLARFQKASQYKVWADSAHIAAGGKIRTRNGKTTRVRR